MFKIFVERAAKKKEELCTIDNIEIAKSIVDNFYSVNRQLEKFELAKNFVQYTIFDMKSEKTIWTVGPV